ncbi:glycosyltransferase family 4 protein [bacterium Scap17]|uniref:glycosyltransferase family 4 protein n=1 Tax=Cobetia amphilecti TaxID=1055104 RepID=UPI00159DC3E2|nr:glycosyltransferase family 4 protein [Cobetia amphilecti]NVN56291.1 glycosyltransferase family 4 protein [bacterium Scap17]UBU47556.1 glycosyltransferase family 4 protein [Cobetia amphilecti]
MSKLTRVFFIGNSAWYLENFRSSTIKTFSDKFSVSCLAPKDDNGIPSYSESAQVINVYLNPTSKNAIKEICSLVSIFFILIIKRPAVVYSFNPKTNLYSLISCWVLRIPCIPNVSGVGQASQLGGVLGKIYSKLIGFFYKRANHVFFQNKEDYQCYIDSGYSDPCCSEVLPGSGVDLKKFCPTYKASGITFLMAARLIYPKGIAEFVESSKLLAPHHSSSYFRLAGVEDNSQRSICKKIIAEFTAIDRAAFLGHVKNMPNLLKSVDCVVLPSYYPEGTPRSLLEAAAAGKVIITTDTPGCRDVVIEGVNGFLVPPRDTEALKEAMEKVINLSDEKLAEMQANSRKLAEEKFDEQYVIQRYLDVAEEILAKKSK